MAGTNGVRLRNEWGQTRSERNEWNEWGQTRLNEWIERMGSNVNEWGQTRFT